MPGDYLCVHILFAFEITSSGQDPASGHNMVQTLEPNCHSFESHSPRNACVTLSQLLHLSVALILRP